MDSIIKNLQKLNNYKYSTISGLNQGEKSFLPFLFLNEKIVIITNNSNIYFYKEQLEGLNKKVLVFDEKIPLLYGFHEQNQEVFKNYFIKTSKLAKQDFDYLVLSPESLFQKLPNKQFVLNNTLKLTKNSDYNLEELSKKLVEMGYKKTRHCFFRREILR